MRTLLVAGLSLMSVAVAAAYAQDSGGGKGRHHATSEQKADTNKPKADEKAYKAALDRIPDAGKQDPWHSIRP